MTKLITGDSFPPEKGMPFKGIQCKDRNYLIVGNATSDTDTNLTCGFVTKIDSGGINWIWSKKYTSIFSEGFKSAAELSDGSYVLTGFYCYSLYSNNKYLLVCKTDSNGNVLWQKALGDVSNENCGYDVKATSDGGFIVIGTSITDHYYSQIYKFDVNDNIQWSKKIHTGYLLSVIQTVDGSYILSGGRFTDNVELSYILVVKLDSNGEVVWENLYKDHTISNLLSMEVIETSIGHFAIATECALMEIDNCGNIIWYFENQQYLFYSIKETSDKNYTVGGSILTNNYPHAYVAKIDSTATKVLWDNVEPLYDSEIATVLVTKDEYIVAIGDIPINKHQPFLAIYDTNNSLI